MLSVLKCSEQFLQSFTSDFFLHHSNPHMIEIQFGNMIFSLSKLCQKFDDSSILPVSALTLLYDAVLEKIKEYNMQNLHKAGTY
jgi:hypothetical protein